MEPVFRKGLAKAAEDRYPNCTAFWQALSDAARAGERAGLVSTMPFPALAPETTERPVTAATTVPAGGSQRGLILAAAGVLAVAMAGGGFWMWSHRDPPPITDSGKDKMPDPPPTAPGDQEKATQPVLIQQVKPDYTPEALKAGIQGSVKLRIGIDEKGQVEEAEVVGPLDPGLDQKAIEAVKKWKFQPAMMKGKPVAMRSRVELEFHIEKQQ